MLRRLIFNHSEKTVSQPSSFVLAVSSETLSVGAYDSIPQIIHMSVCDYENIDGFKSTMANKLYKNIIVSKLNLYIVFIYFYRAIIFNLCF
jgi:hypothetical protein